MEVRILSMETHTAAKTYNSSEGIIRPGDLYYRGFAVTTKHTPFEFVFPAKEYPVTFIPQRVFENGLAKAFREVETNAGEV